jgi:CHAT domain-containing protein
MSDGLLTLRDILDLKLDGIRLAILSACETGLTGTKLADEAISLPTGLLQAGVAGVAASLWSVSDLSTMMLLTRFYDLWRIEDLEIDQALRQAQQWVRDTTNGEKVAYFKAAIPELAGVKLPSSIASFLYQSVRLSNPKARDFAHPFHWAAFQYLGV